MKESSVSTDQSLINKLCQVKEPANLKQLLIEQSIPLFKQLTIKQRHLDRVKNQMKTEILHGSGASTTFNELSGLIDGLRSILKSAATTFGVTPEDVYYHQQVWEETFTNTKTSAGECELPKPNTPGPVIMVECAIKGLCLLPFYDIELLYKLMDWNHGFKSKIPPSWLKDGALVFQVSKDNEKNVKDIVSYCSESGWASSYTENYTGGMIAFVWKSLNEAFREDGQLNDDDDDDDDDKNTYGDDSVAGCNKRPLNRTTLADKSVSSDDSPSDDDPVATPVDESNNNSDEEDEAKGTNKKSTESETSEVESEPGVSASKGDSEEEDGSESSKDAGNEEYDENEKDESGEEEKSVSITNTKRKRLKSVSNTDTKRKKLKSSEDVDKRHSKHSDVDDDESDEEHSVHLNTDIHDDEEKDEMDEENDGVSITKTKRKQETVKQATPARKSPRKKIKI